MTVAAIRKRHSRRFALESLESRLALDASMLLDINPTPVARGSYPRMFTEVNDEVYFLTTDIIGDELWRVTGNSAEQVVDFNLDLVVDGIFPGHLRKIESIGEWDERVELRTGSTSLLLDENDELSVVFSQNVPLGGVDELFELDGRRFGFSSQDTFFNPSLNRIFRVTPEGSVDFVLTSHETDFAGEFTSHFATLGNKVIAGQHPGLGIADASLTGPPLQIESVDKPDAFENVGELVYFFAGDETSFNLWQTDGTEAGTSIASNIATFSLDETLRPIVRQTLSTTDELFFVYSDQAKTESFQLWHSDGENTEPLVGLAFGGPLGAPIEFGNTTLIPEIDEGTILIGTEQVPTHGTLIATDGTPEGTARVIDEQATLHSNPQFTVWNDAVYFVAHTNQDGYELWKTDGTLDGTAMLSGVGLGIETSNISDLRVWNDRLMFVADSELGRELWVSDGTSSGTQPLADINAGPESSNPTYIFEFDDRLYFLAETAAHGQELWSTDGTSEGTNLIRDINPGTAGSDSDQFFEFHGQLAFVAFTNATGSEFWTTDGTAEGTRILMDLSPGPESTTPSDISLINEQIYFSSNAGDTGFEPWVSDGTLEGTRLIKNIVDEGTDSAIPRDLTVAGDQVFFTADDGIHGQELWVSDGTAAGTQLVQDIASGPVSADISEITTVGSNIYFTASDEVHGRELWFSDGTSDGTRMVADIVNGPIGSAPYDITVAGDVAYFVAFDFDHGDELWVTDGTVEGTRLVIDAVPGDDDSPPRELTPHGDQLFFVSKGINPNDGFEQDMLWVTDGSTEGSRIIQQEFNCSQTAHASALSQLVSIGENLHFVACDQLARVSPNGIEILSDDAPFIHPTDDSLILIRSGDWLEYFPSDERFEIFNSTIDPSDPIVLDETQIFFFGDSIYARPVEFHNQVLPIGLNRFPRGSSTAFQIRGHNDSMNRNPLAFEFVDDYLYLVADHVDRGRELWRSDGTTNGTHVITDIAPLGNSSHPTEITQLGDKILFRATTDESGVELWAIDIPQDTIEFAPADYVITEGDGEVSVTVLRNGPLDEELEFTINFVSDSAENDEETAFPDYLATPQTHSFAVGQDVLTIPATILDDERIEPDERFRIEISVALDALAVTNVRSQTSVRIVDNDPPFSVDIDNDSFVTAADLDLLVDHIGRGGEITSVFDSNNDDILDTLDVQKWLEIAGASLNPNGAAFQFGDSNLDGRVDTLDWQLRFSNASVGGGAWTWGHDFNADGVNDVSDFNIWFDHRFQDPAPAPSRAARPPRSALPRAAAFAVPTVDRNVVPNDLRDSLFESFSAVHPVENTTGDQHRSTRRRAFDTNRRDRAALAYAKNVDKAMGEQEANLLDKRIG